MSEVANTNVSAEYIRALLLESSADVSTLCHSPRINKWAKYSPLTRGGEDIPYKCFAVASPWDCDVWQHTPHTEGDGRLGDFRRYAHDAPKPVTNGFPAKLYSNLQCVFGIATSPSEGPYISFNDVLTTSNKYFGVAIRVKSKPNIMIWGTSANKGDSSVMVDLSGFQAYFFAGQTVECVLFYSSSRKPFDAPDMMSDFYSVKVDAETIDRREYTITEYRPPQPWDSFRIIPEPSTGNWSYDEVSFDNIRIELKSVATTTYKHNIRIVTDDGRYYEDNWNPQPVTIQAGQTGNTCETGMISLRFFNNYNLVFIQALDISNPNAPKMIAEIPCMKFIEQNMSLRKKINQIKY